ncbi:MAG: type pilus assembly protein PilC [Actinomycetota bacterium]|nr:type pilus assembly protein PilC [Actinomycetota bacterium]
MSWGAEVSKYAYVAIRPDGQRATGVEQAPNRTAAELALYGRELRDIRVTEKKSFLQLELSAPRVKREEVMHLSRQLGAFVRAGLPLIEAVRTIGEEATNSGLRAMMAEVEEGLRGGERLSDCLDRHPKIFPEFYRGILRSAELTGQLDTVLEQLAKYLERDLEAKRKIKAASIYPAMIALMSLVTVVVLAWFVLPRFKVFFAGLHAKLPLPTRMLLAVTDFFTQWWWAVLAAAAFIVVPSYIENATFQEGLPAIFGLAAMLTAVASSGGFGAAGRLARWAQATAWRTRRSPVTERLRGLVPDEMLPTPADGRVAEGVLS